MNWNKRYALDMSQLSKWPCDCPLCSKLNNTNLENSCIDCGSTTEPLKILNLFKELKVHFLKIKMI